MEPLKLLGKEIQYWRLKKGLSQEELALLSGLNRSYISNVENGTRNLSILNLLKISSALNIAPSELIKKIDT